MSKLHWKISFCANFFATLFRLLAIFLFQIDFYQTSNIWYIFPLRKCLVLPLVGVLLVFIVKRFDFMENLLEV